MPSKFLNLSTDTTLGGATPSDELAVSQRAIKTYVDNHSGGGSVDIDNSTITKNGSDQLQAVATINANTAVGATNPVYDWVGTLAEYTSQAVATNHPDWVCYITDDVEATAYQAYTQSQCNNLFVQKGHQVIEFQEPTSANNYTWYRKYADGWVEQGGWRNNIGGTITFPIPMAQTNQYTAIAVHNGNTAKGEGIIHCYNKTSTGMSYNLSVSTSGMAYTSWYVAGMAA